MAQPHGRDGLRARRMVVLWTFRAPSLCRRVHRAFMRNALLDYTPIIPATACHRSSYVETYSRFPYPWCKWRCAIWQWLPSSSLLQGTTPRLVLCALTPACMITGCNDASSRTRLALCPCYCREAEACVKPMLWPGMREAER